MAYVLWFGTGTLIGMIFGAGSRRSTFGMLLSGSFMAGGFGGMVGGVIAGGVASALSGALTLPSVIGALIGGALLAWAADHRVTDIEP